MSSDHFSPWSERQGESGFAWSWLGAAMATTALPFGVVNAPGQRYHPAIIAQAAATLAEMFPGRLWVALGTGEASNEHITGDRWPDKAHRNRRLAECVDVMRALFAGEEVTHHGLVRVDRARLWTLPATPPPLIGAAVSPETAALGRRLGRRADHRQPGPSTPCVGSSTPSATAVATASRAYLQVHVSWAPTRRRGAGHRPRPVADQRVRPAGLLGPRAASSTSTRPPATCGPRTSRQRVLVSSDPAWHCDRLAELVALGFDGVWIHHVGQQQRPFIDVFGEHVVPAAADGRAAVSTRRRPPTCGGRTPSSTASTCRRSPTPTATASATSPA